MKDETTENFGPLPKEVVTTFYDKNGLETDKESLACAKKTVGLATQLYIKFKDGRPFNPNKQDLHVSKTSKFTLNKVKEDAFKYYLLFLKTKSGVWLHNAERAT